MVYRTALAHRMPAPKAHIFMLFDCPAILCILTCMWHERLTCPRRPRDLYQSFSCATASEKAVKLSVLPCCCSKALSTTACAQQADQIQYVQLGC